MQKFKLEVKTYAGLVIPQVNQGHVPPVRNQVGVERYLSRTDFPKDLLQGHHNCVKANSGSYETLKLSNQKDLQRKKWTREQYKETMEAYYYVKYHPTNEINTKKKHMQLEGKII